MKFILFAVFFINLFSFTTNAVGLSAETAVLTDAESGMIFFSKDSEKRMKPASTTKILTALTALKKSKPDEIVTISRKAAETEGSSIYAEEGESYTMRDLIRGLMMNSGNDAAVAIAEHISGNEEKFSSLMNEVAKECGAKNSNFMNPSGLDHENHYTTAYDLALITSEALKNEFFKEVIKTKTGTINTTDGKTKYLKNHNRLLSEYKDCDGVKTGYTKASGRTLVSSAERDGIRLIAVTMNAPDDWNDHKNLLDYGFLNYEKYTLVNKNDECCKAYVKYGVNSYTVLKAEKSLTYVAKKGEKEKFVTEYLLREIVAPVKAGEVLGEAVVKYNDKEIGRINLFSENCIEKIYIKKTFKEIFSMFFKLYSENQLL